jgi:hypothetical protein
MPRSQADAIYACQRVRRPRMLPIEEEPHEIGRRDRFDLRAQPIEGVPVNAREQPTIAPLHFRRIGRSRSLAVCAIVVLTATPFE